MNQPETQFEVFCVGMACYDVIFSVDDHPKADEKIFARQCLGSGGGPAANAAVACARLGLKTGFAGYLGDDLYGNQHLHELQSENVDTSWIKRGAAPTSLSAIVVKPDGKRALINYKGDAQPLAENTFDFSKLISKAVLFDGHQPYISKSLVQHCRQSNIPTVLDAGSIHKGTELLMNQVDYLVCSEKFATNFAQDPIQALAVLAEKAPNVVITLGERGLVWRKGREQGKLPAYPIKAIDTTGAGDAFHGAFSAAVAKQMDWLEMLQFASAAGALCCAKTGARHGLADNQMITELQKNIHF